MAKNNDPKRKLADRLLQMRSAAKQYDSGDMAAALEMALEARAIFHDGQASASLLSQLYLKNVLFLLSSTTQYIPGQPGAYHGLLGRKNEGDGDPVELLPLSQIDPEFVNKWHGFNDWWNELVVNGNGFTLSRKDIVLMIANQEGGTHLGNQSDPGYSSLPYESQTGWKYNSREGESVFATQLAYATMRQIAFEIAKSFEYHHKIKSYTRKVETKLNAIYLEGMLYFASYECEKYPMTAAALVDPRHDHIENRDICFDSLIFKDGSKNGRILAI